MGQKNLLRLKESLHELRAQVKASSLQESLMVNSLFAFKNRMSSYDKGRNFLYDEIETGEAPADFTEEDLGSEDVPKSKPALLGIKNKYTQ